MKPANHSRRDGFTLIELLTVVVIILVLVGITIAALPAVNSMVARNNIRAFKGLLETGLSSYEKDNGMHPLNEPTGSSPSARDASGLLGSEVLYKHLSGDLNANGQLYEAGGQRDSGDDNAPIYLPELEYRPGEAKSSRVYRVSDGQYLVIDAYSDPMRYLAEKPNKKDKMTVNVTYDLWSLGGTKAENAESDKAQARYITNWGGN